MYQKALIWPKLSLTAADREKENEQTKLCLKRDLVSIDFCKKSAKMKLETCKKLVLSTCGSDAELN